ncbi:MAG: hypothetical protein JKY56_00890 [Kofleriaceae bacterium]|nr:hypothetical protein [Kofleriaceae bacterium]
MSFSKPKRSSRTFLFVSPELVSRSLVSRRVPLFCGVVLGLAFSLAAPAYADTVELLYPGGAPRWRYEVKKGVMEGKSEFFYESGQVMTSGTFERGYKHGVFVYYQLDGSVRERVLYVYGERQWRSSLSGKTNRIPLELLKVEDLYQPELVNTAKLEEWALPWLPFTTLDRVSKRMGISLGTSTEDGQRPVRRTEFYTHIVKGRYGLYLAASQTWIDGVGFMRLSNGERKPIYLEEQGTVQGAATVQVLEESYYRGLTLRLGYLKSYDSNDADDSNIREHSGLLRASDFVSTFPDVTALRASGTYHSSKGYYSTQFDLGIDSFHYIPVGTDVSSSSTLLRMNAGIAYGRVKWQLALETSNTINIDGPSLFSAGMTATYVADSFVWASLNVMSDHNFEQSYALSVGTWLWRIN